MIGLMQSGRTIVSLSLLLLAACESEPLPDTSQATAPIPIPAQACGQVKSGLDKLKEGGALIYTDAGEATMEQAAWLQLDQAAKEQLERLLAFHKACNSKEPAREQEIIIRNEAGLVVTQRVIETSPDVARMFADQ